MGVLNGAKASVNNVYLIEKETFIVSSRRFSLKSDARVRFSMKCLEVSRIMPIFANENPCIVECDGAI